VRYTTVERADNKQFRERCAPAAAIDAIKVGPPFPSGAVITMVKFKAKRNAAASPKGRQRPLHRAAS
jgi:hypothetical protein